MRPFIKQTLISTLGSFFGLILFASVTFFPLLFLTIALISSSGKDSETVIKDKTILVVNISQNIIDFKEGKSLEETITSGSDRSISLKQVIDSINAATKDPKITAIYLDGSKTNANTAGLSILQEVRSALEKFKASGKKIIAYDVDVSKKDYYLMSIADQIFLNPFGSVEMNGLRSEMMFFKGAFDKYGVGTEITRAGKFKSFGETWSQTKYSPQARQETQTLLNSLWGEYKNTISKSRNLEPQNIQNIADQQGRLTAKRAIVQKLVDQTLYFDQVIEKLQQIGIKEKNTFRQISINKYSTTLEEKQDKSSPKIAVVYAQGMIVNGNGGNQLIGGDSLAKTLRTLRNNDKIKAVVLRVNSPGGSATASDIIQREVRNLKTKKPVIISMGDVAASGGYWISSYSDRIFAQSNTITGSIGVIGARFQLQKLGNNNGITWDVVKTAKLADSDNISRPRTPEEIKLQQQIVDDIYDDFITKVAESRKLSKTKVNEIAQGRVWSGIDAKNIGLVDEIGGLQEAINYAVKTAQVGNHYTIEEYPEVESFEERLLKRLSGDAQININLLGGDLITAEFIKLQSELAKLKHFNDPRSVYAISLLNLQID